MNAANHEQSTLVSCQVLGQVLLACDEKGIEISQILQGVPFDRAYLDTSSNFIEWSDLVRLLGNAEAFFSDDEILALSAASYTQPLFIIYKLIGRLRYDLRGFYHYLFGGSGIVTKFYPVRSDVLKDDAFTRNLSFRLRVMEGLPTSRVFFLILQGQARGVSEAMGFGPSEVRVVWDEMGIDLDINLPRERGLFAWLRRLVTRPREHFKAARLLHETQDTLVERNRQLTEETMRLKRTQEALNRQQDQLNLLLEKAPTFLWSVDLDFRFQYCSPSSEAILGYPAEELVTLHPFTVIDEDSRQAVLRTFIDSLKDENNGLEVADSHAVRLRHIRKDGSTFWSENYLAFTRDTDGQPLGVVGASIDIDDQIDRDVREAQLEDELNRSRRQELVGKVAGGIAHDFNNSLQAIIGFSELSKMLLRQGDLEMLGKYQDLILQSGASASELVKQLLAFSRQQTLKLQPVNVADWLMQIKPMLESIAGAATDIRFKLDEDLSILADPVELERVVINLLLNAMEAMQHAGSIDISLSCANRDNLPGALAETGENYVSLAICDSGPGVDPSVLERIFDLYYTTKDGESNSGLGLAVSAGIIEQHAGLISARNNDGGGLTVEILLPVTEQQIVAEDSDIKDHSKWLRGRHVLVVDDQAVITDLVRAMLENEGGCITTAADGAEAVASVETLGSDLDLVLMDIVMPKMSGDIAASRIRTLRPKLPIIFMTGYAGDRTIVDSLRNETVLSKPFPRNVLLEAIDHALWEAQPALP